jgi:hypothetical protein
MYFIFIVHEACVCMRACVCVCVYKGKGKRKFHPITGHEGPEGRRDIAVLFI